jgi:S-methylmethionine-dependent homocysteine/selenocysteine methylase
LFLSDGGLETTLVFHEGVELPDFAAFPLLDTAPGRALISRYFQPYLDLAERQGLGFVLDTVTWRANPDWADRLGYDTQALARVLGESVAFAQDLGRERPGLPVVLNGVVGPRGDGYVVGEAMSADAAADYHAPAVNSFAEAGTEMITAVTMTYAAEAVGITRAAVAAGQPVVISFTVETDGALPSGQALGEAVTQVDRETGGAPAYYMINCAHPTHFLGVLSEGIDQGADADGGWSGRIKGIRANASTMSHAELDEAEQLDRGDVPELAERYVDLRDRLDLRVVGGCCGTDHEHVEAMALALTR